MPGPGGFGGGFGPNRAGGGSQVAAAAGNGAAPAAKKTLWYLDDSGKLAVILVEPGLSDGLATELVGAEELEGRKVILKIKAE
jgi:hypothetical protein